MAEPGSAPDTKALVQQLIAAPAAVVRIGGDEVDLGKIPPLTIGDKRRLFKTAGVDLGRAGRFNPEEEFQYSLYLLRLIRPQTTEPELEAAPHAVIIELSLQMIRLEGALPSRPTSASSPISLGGTAGALATSTG